MYYLCIKVEDKLLGATLKIVSFNTLAIISLSSKRKNINFTDDKAIWKSYKTMRGAEKLKKQFINQDSVKNSIVTFIK